MTEQEQYKLELESFFRTLSANRWSCGWYQNIEVVAWEEMLGLGGDRFEDYELNHLCELARYAGGWCHYVQGQGACFVPMAQWLRMYAEMNKAKSPNLSSVK